MSLGMMDNITSMTRNLTNEERETVKYGDLKAYMVIGVLDMTNGRRLDFEDPDVKRLIKPSVHQIRVTHTVAGTKIEAKEFGLKLC